MEPRGNSDQAAGMRARKDANVQPVCEGPLAIAVGRDEFGWHEVFSEALLARQSAGYRLRFDVVDIGSDSWVDHVRDRDLVIWKPAYMGPRSASHFKEKIYFMEQYLGLLVVPSFRTIWHFESKVAQAYLLRERSVPTPRTVVSFTPSDALRQLDAASLPLVFKASHGASSSNVRMVNSASDARRLIDKVFCAENWREYRAQRTSGIRALLTLPRRRWFWSKVRQKLSHDEFFNVVYWQEFVRGNDADLRITVIGDRYAVGFWRRNRPGDFRASGSGLLDYETPIPEDAVGYCMALNRQFGFDSMAYDLLFESEDFVVVEMSYAYNDKAVFGAPGHYTLGDDDSLLYEAGHVMPQELWVDCALRKAAARRNRR